MTHRWRNSADSSELRVFAASLLAVLGFAALVNHAAAPPARRSAPNPQQEMQRWGRPDYIRSPEAASAYVDKLARQSAGELGRLPEVDQRWLNSLTAGHAADAMRSRFKELQRQAATANRRAAGDKHAAQAQH